MGVIVMMYVCTNACTYVHMYVCYAYVYAYAYVYTYAHVYAYDLFGCAHAVPHDALLSCAMRLLCYAVLCHASR